jgi:hypothetical protein
MAAVFSMQGLGQLCAALVMIFTVLGFKQNLLQSPNISQCTGDCATAVDQIWRILIGLGAVPGLSRFLGVLRRNNNLTVTSLCRVVLSSNHP